MVPTEIPIIFGRGVSPPKQRHRLFRLTGISAHLSFMPVKDRGVIALFVAPSADQFRRFYVAAMVRKPAPATAGNILIKRVAIEREHRLQVVGAIRLSGLGGGIRLSGGEEEGCNHACRIALD